MKLISKVLIITLMVFSSMAFNVIEVSEEFTEAEVIIQIDDGPEIGPTLTDTVVIRP